MTNPIVASTIGLSGILDNASLAYVMAACILPKAIYVRTKPDLRPNAH
jgi:hypothetical protein